MLNVDGSQGVENGSSAARCRLTGQDPLNLLKPYSRRTTLPGTVHGPC